MALTKDKIFAVDDLPKCEVEVPEWGGSVLVRTLSAAEANAFIDLLLNADTDPHASVKVVVLACCDESGQPLFSQEDVERLGKKSPFAIRRIVDKVLAMHKYDDEKVKDIEKK